MHRPHHLAETIAASGTLIDLETEFLARSFANQHGGKDPGPTRACAKDGEIFGENDPAEYFYEVVSGVVRTYKVLSDGRRQIDQFHMPGDLFGLETGPFHRFSAEAVNAAVIRAVRRRPIESFMAIDQFMAKRFIAATAKALQRAQEHMLLLGRKCAKEKVASFLLDVADRLARKGSGPVELPMSRTDIADHLGLTIETVSRTLTQLEREGAIAMPSARRLIQLRNKEILRQLEAGECENRFVPRLVRPTLKSLSKPGRPELPNHP